jgi:hydroxymethylbilane synthase
MIVIGSRGSQLALWQSRWVAARLTELGERVRIDIIKTTGDKITDVALAKVGGKGLFTKEIEDALLAREVDVAVHSLKDMPTELPAGLTLRAVPEREDPRDALVGSTFAALPKGARVGTSSLRRAAQLRARRPDLRLETIRGNLDTRLRKLDEGQFDAIVLAAAGLRRLGWADRIADLLPPELCCPAVGQGALAIETRAGDGMGARLCAQLDHAETRAAVTAERALLAALGGGCQVPIGAHASIEGGILTLRAVVASPDGATVLRGERQGAVTEAANIGTELSRELLRDGARAILDGVYGHGG